MKRKYFILLFTILLTLAIPLTAFAEETLTPVSTPYFSPVSSPSDTPSPTTSPTDTPEPVISAGQLTIDSKNLYPGMNKTYENGYIPIVKDGNVSVVLPLIGKTQDGKVTLGADLGQTADSPFVFGNYAQTREGGEPYLFTLSIPLAAGRSNGTYPVTLNASYLDAKGSFMTQTFIIYVTIADGKNPINTEDEEPVDPNAAQNTTPVKETVDKPELFISSCEIAPASVGGNEEFEVTLTVENIGTLRARSVRLTYGSTSSGGDEAAAASSIVPVATNNAIHLENIADGKSETASFKLKTTADTTSGNQPFSVTLDYTDAYGGVYTSSRTFLIAVTQPADFTYDDILTVIPQSITAGESFTLPANVYNTGKSTLKNVMIEVTGEGLFPKAAAFLGDIVPGGTGNGEISVFVGQVNGGYGQTNGLYTITYMNEAGEEQKQEIEFSIEIKEMMLETDGEPTDETQEPAFRWWVTILVGFAIIAVIVAVVVVTKVLRNSKMK